jgi:hypothetical protein
VTQAAKNSKSIAGSVVVMLIAVATVAWFGYTILFPQDVVTFLVSIIYFPVAGIMIFVVYMRLKGKN